MPVLFQIHQHVENGGDGAVSIKFHPTKEQAVAADEAQDEGWGEPSVKTLKLKIMGGEIYYEQYNQTTHQPEWIRAEKVEEK